MKNRGYKIISCIVLLLFIGLQLGDVAYGDDLKNIPNHKLEREIINKCGEEAFEMLLENFSRGELLDLYKRGKLKISRMNNLGGRKSVNSYTLDGTSFNSYNEESMSFITVIFDDYYDKSDNRTYASLALYWCWENKPSRLGDDAIGIGWSEGMYANSSCTDNNQMQISYAYTFNNEGAKIVDCDYNLSYVDTTGNIMAKIPMRETKNGREVWAKLGHTYIYLSKSGRVPELSVSGLYGHQTVDVDFSLNIGANPVSMTFDDEAVIEVGNHNRYSEITTEKP